MPVHQISIYIIHGLSRPYKYTTLHHFITNLHSDVTNLQAKARVKLPHLINTLVHFRTFPAYLVLTHYQHRPARTFIITSPPPLYHYRYHKTHYHHHNHNHHKYYYHHHYLYHHYHHRHCHSINIGTFGLEGGKMDLNYHHNYHRSRAITHPPPPPPLPTRTPDNHTP